MNLSADSESTQSFGSYRVFGCINHTFGSSYESYRTFGSSTWVPEGNLCTESPIGLVTRPTIMILHHQNPTRPRILCSFRICAQIHRSSPESRVIDPNWSNRTSVGTRKSEPTRPNRTDIRTPHKILTLKTQTCTWITPMVRERGPMVNFDFFFVIWRLANFDFFFVIVSYTVA